jgi:hypothetical protein
MHGNVWEWCYGKFWNFPGDELDDPIGWNTGSAHHIVKGGAWNFPSHRCRSAARYALIDNYPYNFVGFRIVIGEIIEKDSGIIKKWSSDNKKDITPKFGKRPKFFR